MATLPASTGALSRAPFPDLKSPVTYRAISLDTIDVLGRINRACREHNIPVSLFGRRAVRDPRFVHDLRNGRTLRPATAARVLQFIAELEGASC